MFGDEKKEFGDYQTPPDFCSKVASYIRESGLVNNINAVIEPTCGIGNFLYAAAELCESARIFGVEINSNYASLAQEKVPSASVIVGNIFDVNTRALCGENDVLVIGNPPWATNSDLSYNLPRKLNFRGLRGIEAVTGASNFDICEYIILQMLAEYRNTNSVICMLCKTTVARNVVLEISRNQIPCKMIEMLNFNGNKVFGISASACVLIIQLSSEQSTDDNVVCTVKDFESNSIVDSLIVSNGNLRSTEISVNFEGKCPLVWRQGVKHDCGKVMELDNKNGILYNKEKQTVAIEDGLIFPLVKSSHFKKPIIDSFSKYVIVTQRKPKQDTTYIRDEFPRTWQYLNSHIKSFDDRKSIIYKNSPPFSMFGIGDYSYAPYKVGLSGFYKKPLFSLLLSSKPVMTDDTAYFLAFENYDLAYCMMLLLNSELVQNFLVSIAFLDNKRPYTVKLLSRLDLRKCVDTITLEMLKQTERTLAIDAYVSEEMYSALSDYIKHNDQVEQLSVF